MFGAGQAQPLSAGLCFGVAVSFFGKRRAEKPADRCFVFDHQDLRTSGRHSCLNEFFKVKAGGVPSMGIENQNRAPPPRRFSAWIFPPCACTIAWQIASP